MSQNDIKLIQEILGRNKKRIDNNNPHFSGHHKMRSLLMQALNVAKDWEIKLNLERSKLRRKSQKSENYLDESLKTAII